MRVVVDASVLLAVVMMEPHREALLKKTEQATLVAPGSLPWELGNALSAMAKRRRATPDELMQVWEALQEIPVEYVAIDEKAALTLALRLRLYAYDAYLLQCSLEQKSPLLTMDSGLKQAARICSLELWEVEET